MVGSSKILTVSYGTFSCTLEGFDDSFETMKAIAEYFRDLAADDRYFGAEPPTPDAEMLARIAEREISRRVEAREDEGRIVLRAQDKAALAGLPATQPQAAASEPVAEAAAARPEPVMPEPRAEAEPDPAEALRPEGIEAEEAPDAPRRAEPELAQTVTPEIESPEEPVEPVAEDAPAEPQAAPVEPEIVRETAQETALGPAEESWPEAWEAPLVAPAAPQSLAEKLNLIRSVVGGEEYSEDEHAQDLSDPEAGGLPVWDAPEAEAEPAEAGSDPAEVPVLAGDSDFDGALAALMADAEPVTGPTEKALAEDMAEAAEIEGDVEMAETEMAEAEVQTVETQEARSGHEPAGAEAARDGAETTSETASEAGAETGADTGADTGTDAAALQVRRAGARVLKVGREDFETAQAEGLFEPVAQDEIATEARSLADDGPEDDAEDDESGNIFDGDDQALSPEEEADLQRELAEVEAELRAEDEADTAVAAEGAGPVPAKPVPAKPEREKLGDLGDGDDLTRIFEEADSQMAAPETSKRRNTIQHLRAALAATRAEKAAGGDMNASSDDSAYRSDLAAAVRPRRPGPGGARSARPEEPRPAPLKLVAEQRVDTDRGPVRPRRVAVPEPEVLAPQEGGFSEFAAEMGATVLPDLLEAAAAYLADVEGRAQFSRPMLMGKLREVDEEGFSREDGLRSFGQLLREGKLQKLSGGRFSVTEETEFRVGTRRRAG